MLQSQASDAETKSCNCMQCLAQKICKPILRGFVFWKFGLECLYAYKSG